MKESLFNIIQSYIPGTVVLDLFAGSGSLGMEALSRGAAKAIFCDKDMAAILLIKKNLAHCKLTETAQVLNCDYQQAIKKIERETVGLVFLDPPYATGLLQAAIQKIMDANILTEDSMIVAEHPKEETFEEFGVMRTEKYGDICISFLKGR